MVGWGITATLMAGLTSNPVHLYLLRFFLGQSSPCTLFVQGQMFACSRNAIPHSHACNKLGSFVKHAVET